LFDSLNSGGTAGSTPWRSQQSEAAYFRADLDRQRVAASRAGNPRRPNTVFVSPRHRGRQYARWSTDLLIISDARSGDRSRLNHPRSRLVIQPPHQKCRSCRHAYVSCFGDHLSECAVELCGPCSHCDTRQISLETLKCPRARSRAWVVEQRGVGPELRARRGPSGSSTLRVKLSANTGGRVT
jgi:hypothetical protein